MHAQPVSNWPVLAGRQLERHAELWPRFHFNYATSLSSAAAAAAYKGRRPQKLMIFVVGSIVCLSQPPSPPPLRLVRLFIRMCVQVRENWDLEGALASLCVAVCVFLALRGQTGEREREKFEPRNRRRCRTKWIETYGGRRFNRENGRQNGDK